MALKMTRGNVDDITPVSELSRGLTGVMAADKDTVLSFNNFFDFFYKKHQFI